MGKYSRVDGKKSSNYGLTITIVLIVSLCLVGTWMFTSSWSASDDSAGYSSTDTSKDVDSVTKNVAEEKKEENESVTENSQVKTDPEESSDEKAEVVEERKENDESSEDGEKEKIVKEVESESDESKEKVVKDAESESDEAKEKEKTQLEESTEENKSEDGNNGTEENASETEESTEKSNKEVFPAGGQAEITKETSTKDGSWSTQLVESQNEKKAQESSVPKDQDSVYEWKTCNVTAGPDYIPCLDNLQVIKRLQSTMHYEHRERHCPEESPRCLVSLPDGYKRSIKWPNSREKVRPKLLVLLSMLNTSVLMFV